MNLRAVCYVSLSPRWPGLATDFSLVLLELLLGLDGLHTDAERCPISIRGHSAVGLCSFHFLMAALPLYDYQAGRNVWTGSSTSVREMLRLQVARVSQNWLERIGRCTGNEQMYKTIPLQPAVQRIVYPLGAGLTGLRFCRTSFEID